MTDEAPDVTRDDEPRYTSTRKVLLVRWPCKPCAYSPFGPPEFKFYTPVPQNSNTKTI